MNFLVDLVVSIGRVYENRASILIILSEISTYYVIISNGPQVNTTNNNENTSFYFLTCL